MNRRHFLSLAAAAAAAATVSACTPEPAPVNGNATGQSGPSASPTAAPAPTEFYTGIPDAVWDEAASADAVKAARTAMDVFVDVSGGQEAWWGRFAPLLAGSYADEAFHIDVARINIGPVSAPELVNPARDPLTTHAVFGTSDGRWELVLHREGPGSPWLVFGLGHKEEQ